MLKRGLPPRARFAAACAALCVFAALAMAAEEQRFTILHTNDEHSMLLPSPLADYLPGEPDTTAGGFARLSTLVKGIRAEKAAAGEPVLLVSGGDILGGGPHCWLTLAGQAAELDLMQRMGYDVVTVGNHEFDYGAEALGHYYLAAGYPEAHARTALVSSNLVIPEDQPLHEAGILETHIVTLDHGLRVGFFGYLGHYAARLATLMGPVSVSDPAEAAREAIALLRSQGADVVVGVSHSGLFEDEDIVARAPGIDVLVASHCHTALHAPLRWGDTIVVQAGGYLRYLGMLELAYDPTDGSVRVRNEAEERPFLVPIDGEVAEDPEIAAAVDEYTAKLNEMTRRLTRGAVESIDQHVLHSDILLEADKPRQESVFGNFVADAMRIAAEAHTGERVDLAIQANGVIRGSVRPGTAPGAEGRVTFHDLATSTGLGTGRDGNPGFPLVSFYLTGKDIYRMLEGSLFLSDAIANIFFLQVSGARIAYDPARTVLFSVPFTRISVPTLRAVREVALYGGDGVQGAGPETYRAISRRDNTLYHVVCDAYILSFFSRVGDLLPLLSVVPKDRHGNPIAPEDAVIQTDQGELKVWQAVAAHALAQPPGSDGLPRLPEHYARTGARITHESGYPLALWAIPVAALLFFAGRRFRRFLPGGRPVPASAPD